MRSPWSLVPVFEEKYKAKIPEFLKTHDSELQELRNAFDQYLTLRSMIYHLKFKVDLEKHQDFPFENEHRDVYDWNVGDDVFGSDKTLVL